MCSSPVNAQGIQCDLCDKWCHPECVHLDQEEYDRLGVSDEQWLCTKCRLPSSMSSSSDMINHQDQCELITQKYPRDIKIIHYNIQSLTNVIDELRVTYENKPFDLICLSETWLKPSHLDIEINIPGYSILRRDRIGTRSGGVAIYHADGISMFRRFDLEHNDLEHIVVEIRIPNRKPFLITCVYIPPREANHVTLTTLSDMLARCLDSKLELILMGDLNFNLLPSKDDSLSALCESYHMDQLIHTRTRVTSHSESLLDIVITTNKEVVCDSGVLIHSMSDHHAVYCVRKSTLKLSPRFSTYCDMRNFNSDSFCRDLSQVPWSICEIFNDINDCYYAWYTLFMEIANEHAPIRTKKCKKRQVPWMNLEIKELMRQRPHSLYCK